MQKEYKKFLELIRDKEVTADNLQSDIEAKEHEILSLETEYKKALIKNDDKKADSIQDSIYELKKAIQRNRDKISLSSEGDTTLEEQATKVLEETNTAIKRLNDEASVLGEEYYTLFNQLVSKAREIGKYRSADNKYIRAVENVANKLPLWADKQGKPLRYDKPVKRYKYTEQSRVPTLKALNERELYKVERGV